MVPGFVAWPLPQLLGCLPFALPTPAGDLMLEGSSSELRLGGNPLEGRQVVSGRTAGAASVAEAGQPLGYAPISQEGHALSSITHAGGSGTPDL